MANSDELNKGYLSRNILYKFYRVVDCIGYKFIKRKPLQLINNRLLFINLGLIGDLILFRYVIEDFLKLGYEIALLIQNEYTFLFNDLPQIKIFTVTKYKDKKILSGFLKIFWTLKKSGRHYDLSCHFRGYLGTGILSTFLSGVARQSIGYATAGFGFLLNHRLEWQTNVHETIHLINVLQAFRPEYNLINLNVYDKYLSSKVLLKYDVVERNYIVIHATSQNSVKNIPGSIIANTVDYIINSTNLSIIIVGTLNEANYVKNNLSNNLNRRIIFTNGEISLFEVRDFIAKAYFFIGVDSSIAHLSSSLNLPKIILWHNFNSRVQWQPLGDNFIILEHDGKMNDNILVNAISLLPEIYL